PCDASPTDRHSRMRHHRHVRILSLRRQPRTRAGLIAALCLLAAGAPTRTDDALPAALAIEQTFAEVIAAAESGVVSIARRDVRADSEPQLRHRPLGPRPGQESISLSNVPEFFGTGVVIARDDADGK